MEVEWAGHHWSVSRHNSCRNPRAYEQWGALSDLERAGLRPGAFPYEPEMVGRTPSLVIGKWSDLAAVERRLADLGMGASAEQVQAIFRRAVTAALARRRPLTDAEFFEVASAEGAVFSA